MKRLGLFVLVFVLLLSTVVFATPKDILVIGTREDVRMLDPAVTFDNQDWRVTYPCYDRLVKYKGSSTEVEPSVAESWSANEDGTVWTFKLKKGIKFDDGTPLDARAVKFTFERLKKIGKGPSDYFTEIKEIKILGDYEVQFVLEYPYAPFIYTLATNAASILNPNIIKHEENGDLAQKWLATHIDGSGPFRLKEWVKDEKIVLEAKDNYWGEKPKLKEVIIKVIKESTDQRMALERGDIDIADGILVDQLDKLSKNPDVVIRKYPSQLCNYVYINNQKKPLDNKLVRQALNYAVDYQGIIDFVLKGNGIQMRGPIPKGMWGHSEDVFQYTYNPKKAKELLKKAGYAKGLELEIMYSSVQPTWEEEVLILQSNFSDIGVKLNIRKLANPTMREKVDKGQFDLCMGRWSPDFADPSMFMNYWFDSSKWGLAGNRSFYKNDEVDKLIREALKIPDQKKREELYKKAQDIIMEDAPYILLYQTMSIIPMRKEVKNFIYNPMLERMYNFESIYK